MPRRGTRGMNNVGLADQYGYDLGYALGSIYGGNETERGIRKGQEEARLLAQQKEQADSEKTYNILKQSKDKNGNPLDDAAIMQVMGDKFPYHLFDSNGNLISDTVQNGTYNYEAAPNSGFSLSNYQVPNINVNDMGQGGISARNPQMQMPVQQPPSDDLYRQAQAIGALDSNPTTNGYGLDSIYRYQNGNNVFQGQDYMNQKKNLTADEKPTSVAEVKRDLQAEKQDYIANKYVNGDTPNPDGDAIKINDTADKAAVKLQNTDFTKLPIFDSQTLKSEMISELYKNGRTTYQIQKVMEMLSPMIDSKVNEANQLRMNYYDDMLNRQLAAGDIDNAAVTLGRMAQINPQVAQAYGRRIAQANDDAQREAMVQRLMKDHGFTEQEARNYVTFHNIHSPKELEAMGMLGGYGGGYGGGRGNGGYPRMYSDSGSPRSTRNSWNNYNPKVQIDNLQKLIKEYNDILASSYLDPEVRAGTIKALNVAQAQLNSLNEQTKYGDAVTSYMNALIKSGMTVDEAANRFWADSADEVVSDEDRMAASHAIGQMYARKSNYDFDEETQRHSGKGSGHTDEEDTNQKPKPSPVGTQESSGERQDEYGTSGAALAAREGTLGEFIANAFGEWGSKESHDKAKREREEQAKRIRSR